ncbi:MAG: thermonuclease family protein [Deltaproteobacteria bacterium]|nr:thermonuclease family protein [Deltaproteobacteria bacterium]
MKKTGGFLSKQRALKKFFVSIAVVFALTAVFSLSAGIWAGENNVSARKLSVTWVIDGDTIEVAKSGRGKERIRYAGIDTPEMEEPFYKEARLRNKELLDKAGLVTFEVCRDEPFDKYGRTLGWVYADGVDVSEALLKEGLARIFAKPPCGKKKYASYKAAEKTAKEQRLGMWGAR